jgi:uncharacterized membrane protein
MTLRDTVLPRDMRTADWWVCGLVLLCFLSPAVVIFIEQTIIALGTIAQSLSAAGAVGTLLGAYALIAYPVLRSVAPRSRLKCGIAIAVLLPVVIRFILTGVFLPGLRPGGDWLLRLGAAVALLSITARWLRRRHLPYIVVAVVVLSAAISWRFYYHGDWIVDLFMFRQALWTTLHGQGFFWVSDEGGSHFGTHNSPFLFLVLPLYAIWGSGALLLLLQSVAVALSAYPVYGLARDRLDESPAMIVTVGFLLLMPVIGPTLSMFKELPFALPLFLAALLAFERGRLKAFAAWAAALLMIRETLAITVVLFALYALARRRGWRWVALPAAMGLLWGVVSFVIVMPHFFVPGVSNRPFLALYGSLGSNMPELVINVAKHPAMAWHRLYSRENLDYLDQLTRPFGRFLPLGSVMTVFAVPDAIMVGLSHKLGWPTHDVAANYHVIIAAALMAALLYVVLGLKRRFALSHAPVYLAIGLFFLTSVTDSLAVIYSPRHAIMWPEAKVRARREIVGLVPPQASVSCSYSMLIQFAHRRTVYPVIPFVKETQRPITTDYVAMEREVENPTLMSQLAAAGYRQVARRPPFVLYQKPGAPPLLNDVHDHRATTD